MWIRIGRLWRNTVMRCPLLLLVVHRPSHLAALLALELMIVVIDLLELVAESFLEVLESKHHHGDVVERLVGHARLHHLLHYIATYLVNGQDVISFSRI